MEVISTFTFQQETQLSQSGYTSFGDAYLTKQTKIHIPIEDLYFYTKFFLTKKKKQTKPILFHTQNIVKPTGRSISQVSINWTYLAKPTEYLERYLY